MDASFESLTTVPVLCHVQLGQIAGTHDHLRGRSKRKHVSGRPRKLTDSFFPKATCMLNLDLFNQDLFLELHMLEITKYTQTCHMFVDISFESTQLVWTDLGDNWVGWKKLITKLGKSTLDHKKKQNEIYGFTAEIMPRTIRTAHMTCVDIRTRPDPLGLFVRPAGDLEKQLPVPTNETKSTCDIGC